MILTDTHAHIYAEEFKDDIGDVILRARQNNVTKVFLPVTEYESISPMLDLYHSYPDMFLPMVGLYPGSVKEDFRQQLDKIYPFVKKEEIAGIGEIGLDFYWDRDFEQFQIEAFEIQMRWSKENSNMPVSIHCRKAFNEIFASFKHLNYQQYNGVFHCFSGNMQQASALIELGFKLGIGGVVTFKNSHLADIVKNVSLENIVLETDSPYLSPVPYRGKRNEPSNIAVIASYVAQIKEISLQEVACQTTCNAENLLVGK